MSTKPDNIRRLLGQQSQASPVGQFFDWWKKELLGLIPHWLQEGDLRLDRWVFLSFTPTKIERLRWYQQSLQRQGDCARAPTETFAARSEAWAKGQKWPTQQALCLTAEQILVKKIEVPLAMEENIRQALAFDLERQTPFSSQQAYFDYKILQRDTANNVLVLNLAVVPRHLVDAPLAALAQWGMKPKAVFWAGDLAADGSHFNFLPTALKPSARHGVPWWLWALLLVAVCMAVIAALIPLWQQKRVLDSLEPRITAARQAAAKVSPLVDTLDAMSAERNFLLKKKQHSIPVTALANEIADLMPNDTWVKQFELHGRELQLQGDTAASTELIGWLSDTGFVQDPSFRSALTPSEKIGFEKYHLAMAIDATAFANPVALRAKRAEANRTHLVTWQAGAAKRQAAVALRVKQDEATKVAQAAFLQQQMQAQQQAQIQAQLKAQQLANQANPMYRPMPNNNPYQQAMPAVLPSTTAVKPTSPVKATVGKPNQGKATMGKPSATTPDIKPQPLPATTAPVTPAVSGMIGPPRPLLGPPAKPSNPLKRVPHASKLLTPVSQVSKPVVFKPVINKTVLAAPKPASSGHTPQIKYPQVPTQTPPPSSRLP